MSVLNAATNKQLAYSPVYVVVGMSNASELIHIKRTNKRGGFLTTGEPTAAPGEKPPVPWLYAVLRRYYNYVSVVTSYYVVVGVVITVTADV